MKLHEYQAKKLLSRYGVPVPAGVLIAASAPPDTSTLATPPWVLKAQVHSGARGKAGGIRMIQQPEALAQAMHELLGSHLVTHQTGPAGLPVERLWLEDHAPVGRELYLAMLVDRPNRCLGIIASASGGQDIETLAREQADQLHSVRILRGDRLRACHVRQLAWAMDLPIANHKAFGRLLDGLFHCFTEHDLSLLEINPLLLTEAGDFLALDAKVQVDDNALYRQKELAEQSDPGQSDARELIARQHGLNFIPLEGNIGCMVNGAGLAMATMDLIQLHGGQPANFLDVGGNTTADRVAEAFKLILADSSVRSILVNIFGGIVRCDLIAQGILQAAEHITMDRPLVVRLEGTHAEQGRSLLRQAEGPIHEASDLNHAAELAVQLAHGHAAS